MNSCVDVNDQYKWYCRCKELEEKINDFQQYKNYQIENNRELSRRIDELEIQLETVRALGSRALHPKKPHKCPVCDGNGMKQNPFLTVMGEISNFDCGSCEGKGIIWG